MDLLLAPVALEGEQCMGRGYVVHETGNSNAWTASLDMAQALPTLK